MATLYRSAVHPLVESKCSAASFFGNRVAVRSVDSDAHLYAASGKDVFKVVLDLPQAAESSSIDSESKKEAPSPINLNSKSHLIDSAQSEIHSIHFAASFSEPQSPGYLYSSDAKGRVIIRSLNLDGTVNTTLRAEPQRMTVDTGFTSIATDPIHPTKFALARYADKSITLFDGDRAVRTFHTIQRPTGIVHLGASHPNLMAVLEWNQLTIWDDRVMEKSGCSTRVIPGPEPLYAICAGHPNNASQKSLIAYGGAARAVTIFDVEKMSNAAHWTGSLKYDILFLNFASKNPKHVFAAGFDSEVVCGDWEVSGADRFEGLRFENRWIGQRVHSESDSLIGVTQDGYAYVLRNGSSLVVPSGKFDRKRQLSSTADSANGKAPKRQKQEEN